MINYPVVSILEHNWLPILFELEALVPQNTFVKWHERLIYEGTWNVYGLYGIDGKLNEKNAEQCPNTVAIIETIPKMRTAGFSMLAPGSRISPHKGYTDEVLRCHLGLVVPGGDCHLRVEKTTYTWKVGKAFVFDDGLLHEAWNLTDSPRYILLVDFYK
jgi:beta-hydroxylase